MNHCIIYYRNNCKSTFAPPCIYLKVVERVDLKCCYYKKDNYVGSWQNFLWWTFHNIHVYQIIMSSTSLPMWYANDISTTLEKRFMFCSITFLIQEALGCLARLNIIHSKVYPSFQAALSLCHAWFLYVCLPICTLSPAACDWLISSCVYLVYPHSSLASYALLP